MASRYEEFNPDDCSQEQLNYLADHLENYLTVLTRSMIVPDEIVEEYGKQINESIRRTRKLIKELRKGNAPINTEYLDC